MGKGIVSKDPTHIFEDLEENTEYKIKVEVKDKADNTTTVEKTVTTVDGIDSSKYIKIIPNTRKWTRDNVIVTVKENCEGSYQAEYSKDGKTWEPLNGEIQIEMAENGTIYGRVKNDEEVGDTISLTVGNIDRQAPKSEITTLEKTSRSVKVNLNVTEDISGIAKIVWSYKAAKDDMYKS